MRSAGNEKMVEAIDDAPAVQFMRAHHLVQGPHGTLQDTRVLLTMALPLPIVNSPAKRLLKNQLSFPSAAVGHEKLDVLSVAEKAALCKKLKREDGFPQVPVCHVRNVTKDANRGLKVFLLADGFQPLLDHQPIQRRHANMLRTTSKRLYDS